MKYTFLLIALCFPFVMLSGREIHVSKAGNDSNKGSLECPYLTIAHAASVAVPGDVITIHEGTYRECIVPPRGGISDKQRITYQAADGEKVIVTGAELTQGWKHVKNNTWVLTLPDAYFGETNPFDEQIYGSWYRGKGRPNHTGMVFLNDTRIRECFSMEEVMKPLQGQPYFYAKTDGNGGKVLMNLEWIKPSGGSLMNSMEASVKGGDQSVCIAIVNRWPFGYLKDNSEIYFDNLDFGTASDSLFFQVATLAKGGMIEVYLDKPDGEKLGTAMVTNTGDWEQFAVFSLQLNRKVQGKHNVCLRLKALAPKMNGKTTIWAQFPDGTDPNKEKVEITKRSHVFYPGKVGINYLTIRGLILEKAATNWAPPSAEQPGLIGTRWGKGWLIENNTIRFSRCSGIALGRPTYGHAHHYQKMPPRIYAEDGCGQTVEQLADYFENASWDKEATGHHVIRNNHIHDCGQTGIVGCSGGAFSLIEGNEIHDICVDETFEGDEMAGIKLHFANDAVLKNNHIYRTIRGLWLDWGAQGVQVIGNLFHDNKTEDIFSEVCHGPILIANNILLSAHSLSVSQGVAGVHNLIKGRVTGGMDRCAGGRLTYFYPPHGTCSLGKVPNPGGDYQWFNNLLTDRDVFGEWDNPKLPINEAGNSFSLKDVCLEEKSDGWFLRISVPMDSLKAVSTQLVDTHSLRKTVTTQQEFTNPDGSAMSVDRDYWGEKRNRRRPCPGAFEMQKYRNMEWLVWKK